MGVRGFGWLADFNWMMEKKGLNVNHKYIIKWMRIKIYKSWNLRIISQKDHLASKKNEVGIQKTESSRTFPDSGTWA